MWSDCDQVFEVLLRQQNLYFLPEWQGQGSFRPILEGKSMGWAGLAGSNLGLFCGMGRVEGMAFNCLRLR